MNKNQAIILSALSEKEFMQQVIDEAHAQGWLVFHPFISQRSAFGFPDLCMVKSGRVVYAELKNDRVTFDRALTKHQREWLDALDNCLGVEVYRWQPRDMDVIRELLSMKLDTESVLAAVKRGVAKGLSLTIGRAS